MDHNISERYRIYPTPWYLIGRQGTAIWSGNTMLASMAESRTDHRIARNSAALMVKAPDMLAELETCKTYFHVLGAALHNRREWKGAQDCKTRVKEIEALLRAIAEGGK